MSRPEHDFALRVSPSGRIAALVLTAIALAMAAFAQAPDPLLQRADDALKKNDYAAAAQALETYLRTNAKDFRAEFNLAYVYSLLEKRPEAIVRYRHVLSLEPGVVEAKMNLGILLAESGDATQAAEAERYLREAVEKQPANANAAFLLAESLAALKRGPEAVEFYEKSLKLKPDQPRVHLGMGKVLEPSNAAAAEEHYRKAALDPSLEEASLRLAALLEARAASSPDALVEASRIYAELLKKHPNRSDLRVRLGEDLSAGNRFSDAAQEFELARAFGDHSVSLARALVKAYLNSPAAEAQRNAGLALALLKEILDKDPGDTDSRMLAGRLRMERKEYKEAASEFAQVAKLLPEPAEAYRNIASAFFLMGETEATLGALARIAELKQDTAGTYFLRAVCLDRLHVRREALENYQKFLAESQGKTPDQEFQARQRSRILELEIEKGMGGNRR